MNCTWFACLLVLLFAGTLIGQTVDQPSTTCNLAREKAPAVRGVKLGMTADEINALIPGIREDYKDVLVQARSFPHFGSAFLDASIGTNDTEQRFNGIERFNLFLFDGHVVQYTVYYRGPFSNPRGPFWPNMDDFTARFADTFHLPGPTNWAGATQAPKVLRCKGFEVQISPQNNALQVMVDEAGRPWVAEQKKRREAYEEQLRRDFKPE